MDLRRRVLPSVNALSSWVLLCQKKKRGCVLNFYQKAKSQTSGWFWHNKTKQPGASIESRTHLLRSIFQWFIRYNLPRDTLWSRKEHSLQLPKVLHLTGQIQIQILQFSYFQEVSRHWWFYYENSTLTDTKLHYRVRNRFSNTSNELLLVNWLISKIFWENTK